MLRAAHFIARTVIPASLALGIALTPATPTLGPLSTAIKTPERNVSIPLKPQRLAIACVRKSEQTSGFNRICIYNCLGSDYAITVKLTELCPLSIDT